MRQIKTSNPSCLYHTANHVARGESLFGTLHTWKHISILISRDWHLFQKTKTDSRNWTQKIEIECRKLKLNRLTVKQLNKMADSEESNNILIQSLKETAKNKSTKQSTKWIKVWKSWASDNRYDKRRVWTEGAEQNSRSFRNSSKERRGRLRAWWHSYYRFFSCMLFISNHMIFSRNLK